MYFLPDPSVDFQASKIQTNCTLTRSIRSEPVTRPENRPNSKRIITRCYITCVDMSHNIIRALKSRDVF